eukprot:scaffold90260_cov69-Phaeocystis_antarctica.AAC.3
MPPHGAEAASWDTLARRRALQRQAAPGIAVPIGETQRERSPATARREARSEPHLNKPDLVKRDRNGAETYRHTERQRTARPNTVARISSAWRSLGDAPTSAQEEPCLDGFGEVLAARRKAGPTAV